MTVVDDVLERPSCLPEVVEEALLAEATTFAATWSVPLAYSARVERLGPAVNVVPPGSCQPVALAAIGHADRLVVWPACPRTLHGTMVPTPSRAAAGARAPRLVAPLPAALAAIRRGFIEEEALERCNGMDSRRRPLELGDLPSGGGPPMVGTKSEMEKRLRSHPDVSVTELWSAMFPAGDDPVVRGTRTQTVLGCMDAVS